MSEFTPPTAEQVQSALRRVTTYQLRRVFYEGLKNPHWVKPLADAGVFRCPPEPEATNDGYVREAYWPEIEYLTSVATQNPSSVVDVLLELGSSNNSWVRRALFTIGAQIPATEAVRLKPVVDRWAESGYGWRTDPRDLVSFAVNLIQGGEASFGISFANKLFRPRVDQEQPGGLAVEMKDYWYPREMPRLTRALGERALPTVLPWLVEYERIEKTFDEHHDFSGYSRALISGSQESLHEVSDALIDAVRDSAIEAFGIDPESTWTLLNRSPILIVRRITLHALRRAIEQKSEQEANTTELITIALELLADQKCHDRGALVEFVEMAQAIGTASPSALSVLREVLDQGPYSVADIGRITQNLRERGEDDSEIETQITQWQVGWRHRVLSGIGRDLLPPDLQQVLDVLDSSRGSLVDPVTPSFRTGGWVGPNSPISQEDMSAMTPLELVVHLEAWHDDGDGWGPEPSHEGHARVLTEVISANPMALNGEQSLIERLRPTYLRAILTGWETARKAGRELPWLQMFTVVTDVLAHGDVSSFPPEGGRFDDDTDFRETKKAAVRLLGRLAQPATADPVAAEYVPQIGALLLESLRDSSAWNEYEATRHELGDAWDPLSVSLNWMWPIQIRGLINLVAMGPEMPWYSQALDALERQLARDDSAGASRAVLGEGLGKLLSHARDWLNRHLSEYFGTRSGVDRNQQIALTTAIAMHYYHPELYELLSDSMIAALCSDEDLAVGWNRGGGSPRQRIGEWVINAIVRGHVGIDDPLRNAFYTQSSAETRGGAIGHIAWSFMHADAVDDAIRDRLADLWDQRVKHVKVNPEDKQELKDFYWFIRSEKFPTSWWLPRLKEALDLNGALDTHGMIGELLAEAAAEFPRTTLDVVAVSLRSADALSLGSYDLRRHALAPAIAAGLESGDQRLIRDTKAFMNEMGAGGEIDLELRVQAIRDRQDT